jgi:hypothetical protein
LRTNRIYRAKVANFPENMLNAARAGPGGGRR